MVIIEQELKGYIQIWPDSRFNIPEGELDERRFGFDLDLNDQRYKFTPRQRDVLACLAAKKTSRTAIAECLGVKEATVRTVLTNMRMRLVEQGIQVNSKVDILAEAYGSRLLCRLPDMIK